MILHLSTMMQLFMYVIQDHYFSNPFQFMVYLSYHSTLYISDTDNFIQYSAPKRGTLHRGSYHCTPVLTSRHYLDECLDSGMRGLRFEHGFVTARGTVVRILHGEHALCIELHHGES